MFLQLIIDHNSFLHSVYICLCIRDTTSAAMQKFAGEIHLLSPGNFLLTIIYDIVKRSYIYHTNYCIVACNMFICVILCYISCLC